MQLYKIKKWYWPRSIFNFLSFSLIFFSPKQTIKYRKSKQIEEQDIRTNYASNLEKTRKEKVANIKQTINIYQKHSSERDRGCLERETYKVTPIEERICRVQKQEEAEDEGGGRNPSLRRAEWLIELHGRSLNDLKQFISRSHGIAAACFDQILVISFFI